MTTIAERYQGLRPDQLTIYVPSDGSDWCHVYGATPEGDRFLDQGHPDDVYERLIESYFPTRFTAERLDRVDLVPDRPAPSPVVSDD